LILIVVFSGYENFVSKIDPGSHPDWPEWMTKINFGGLKQKLMASIVAISAIQVLKAFMNIDTNFDPTKLAWLVGVHLAFVFSAFMLAISDRWSGDRYYSPDDTPAARTQSKWGGFLTDIDCFDAAYLGISQRQLRRLPIPKVRLGERTIRYLFKQLVAWLESKAA